MITADSCIDERVEGDLLLVCRLDVGECCHAAKSVFESGGGDASRR